MKPGIVIRGGVAEFVGMAREDVHPVYVQMVDSFNAGSIDLDQMLACCFLLEARALSREQKLRYLSGS